MSVILVAALYVGLAVLVATLAFALLSALQFSPDPLLDFLTFLFCAFMFGVCIYEALVAVWVAMQG